MTWIFIYLMHSGYLLISNKKRIHDGLTMRLPSDKTVMFFHTFHAIFAILLIFALIFPIFLTPYPDFYLMNNVSVVFLIVVGPLLGITIALLREHTNFESGILGMFLMIAMVLAILAVPVSDEFLSLGEQKISFLKAHDPLFEKLYQEVHEEDDMSIQSTSTSHEIPLGYEIHITRKETQTPEGFSISGYEAKNETIAAEQLKENLIETYRYEHGHIKLNSIGFQWSYAPVPNEETLSLSYPRIDEAAYGVEEGYQIGSNSFIVRKGKMVYSFSVYDKNQEENERLLQLFQDYFKEGSKQ